MKADSALVRRLIVRALEHNCRKSEAALLSYYGIKIQKPHDIKTETRKIRRILH